MTAAGGHRKGLLWAAIIIVAAASLGLSVACGGRMAGAIPLPAAPTSAATPTIPPTALQLLKVSPEEGAVGTAITVTGDGLPAGKVVDLVWAANVDDREMTHERFFVGRSVTDATGGFTALLTAITIADHCELYDIYAVVEGEALAKGGFRVPRPVGSPLI